MQCVSDRRGLRFTTESATRAHQIPSVNRRRQLNHFEIVLCEELDFQKQPKQVGAARIHIHSYTYIVVECS